MTTFEYDWEALYSLYKLHSTNAVGDQERLIRLLQQLSSGQGWVVCAAVLLGEFIPVPAGLQQQATTDLEQESLKFFCCRGIEEYLKNSYAAAGNEEVNKMKLFMLRWMQWFIQTPTGRAQPKCLKLKAVQLITLVCLHDYPARWPGFFVDMLAIVKGALEQAPGHSHEDSVSKCQPGPDLTTASSALDLLLSVLLALDEEVVCREYAGQQPGDVAARSTLIKDHMREHDVHGLVEAWYYILGQGGNSAGCGVALRESTVMLCLEVISLYITWIDLNLIINPPFVARFRDLLLPQPGHTGPSPALQGAVCTCLAGIMTKGMPAGAKAELIDYLWRELGAGLLRECSVERMEGAEGSYLEDLGRLVNTAGLQLIEVYRSLRADLTNSTPCIGQQQLCNVVTSLESKVDLGISLLGHSEQEVSQAVIELIHAYVGLLKGTGPGTAAQGSNKKCAKRKHDLTGISAGLTNGHHPPQNGSPELSWGDLLLLDETRRVRLQRLLATVIEKMKLDPEYDFERSGEEEEAGEFHEFRRDLRTLVANLVQLDANTVVESVRQWVVGTMEGYRQGGFARVTFAEAEVALVLLHHLGETLKSAKGDCFAKGQPHRNAMLAMMEAVCTSGVSTYPHPAVQLQFFETVVRYERYFAANPALLPDILMSFLDERGLRHPSQQVRSRCAYLLTRVIKTHKSQLSGRTEHLLTQLADLLILPGQDTMANGNTVALLPVTEQSYLYESAAQLILATNTGRTEQLFRMLLAPVMVQYPRLVGALAQEHRPSGAMSLAQALRAAADLISRTLRAFTASQTLTQTGCVSLFLTDAWDTLVDGLVRLPHASTTTRSLVCAGVRGFLHRLCAVCLLPTEANGAGDTAAQAMLLAKLPQALQLLLVRPANQCGHVLGEEAMVQYQQDTCREMRELIPLVNQVVTRFKDRAQSLLTTILPDLVGACVNLLAAAPPPPSLYPDAAEEYKLFRRAYLQLVSAVSSVLPAASLPPTLVSTLLVSVLASCTACAESDDPQGFKLGVAFLGRVVADNGAGAMSGDLGSFVLTQVVPLLVMTPARPNFQIGDAQYALALHEVAACQRAILDKQGKYFVDFLRHTYLPSLNLCPDMVTRYVEALQSPNLKEFQAFLKGFYSSCKS